MLCEAYRICEKCVKKHIQHITNHRIILVKGICGWLTLANSQIPTQHLAHSPLPWDEDKMEGKNTHCLIADNDCLIGKTKASCSSKA